MLRYDLQTILLLYDTFRALEACGILKFMLSLGKRLATLTGGPIITPSFAPLLVLCCFCWPLLSVRPSRRICRVRAAGGGATVSSTDRRHRAGFAFAPGDDGGSDDERGSVGGRC
jgi:hypothetical protein